MKNNVLILCRGNSLSRFDEINKEFDLYSLVNGWTTLLERENFGEKLIGKNLIQYCCRDEHALLSKKCYKKYDIKYSQLNTFENDHYGKRVYSILKNWNIKTKFLSKEMKKVSIDGKGGFPTTGILSIVDAVVSLKKTDVSVIGMDFYEDTYYTDDTYYGTKQVMNYHPKKGKKMKSYLVNFLESNSDVKFTFYTNSSFNPNLSNVEIR